MRWRTNSSTPLDNNNNNNSNDDDMFRQPLNSDNNDQSTSSILPSMSGEDVDDNSSSNNISHSTSSLHPSEHNSSTTNNNSLLNQDDMGQSAISATDTSDDTDQQQSSSQSHTKHHHDHNDDNEDNTDNEDETFDSGQDHAIPDDPRQNIPNHSMIWKPQNTTSTCEFTHTITNYSQKRQSGCKKAEYSETTIDSHGNRWRLIVYVNGNGRASNHHLSLFLQVADAEELPFGWKKAVSYVLTLEHPSGPTLGYAKRNPDKMFKLCPKAIDWGWSQFITSDRVQQEGYINQDSLIVRASVSVKSSSISIDPDDAELYLKCAVEEGNAEAVETCLEQGASVNCKFKDDLYSPLHTACSSSANDGSLDVLKLLLKRGANGNACNKWKETPLLIAANNGHRAAVEALLDNGADPSMCSEAGWSALTFAAHKGYDDIVSLLLDAGAPVNCRVIEDFSTPLHKACAGGKPGHLSAVKQLIRGNADVHSLNKWRETPLLTAANHGQAKAVEALLDAGGDPCKCTDTGWSPLSIAAYKGHDDVVRLLLEQGAPTEEEDPTLSALLQAATKGLPDTVELLLRHGADHTVTTKKGDTALSILVEQNLIDAAVEMVTEYKASIPRCSRDRKKVQRARLLINLRVKQQQRDGLLNDSDSGEYSDNDDSDEGSRSALHDDDTSPKASSSVSSKSKMKKKKGKSRETAEAQANKAAEALLLELEQEDAQAQKDEAAANSKRNKKKKKKERERQQKLEEERQRQEKERKAEEERERQKQLREEKERKERIAKEKELKELKEKEMKEAAEREQRAAKRREKEAKEKKKREDAEKEKLRKEEEVQKKEQDTKKQQQLEAEAKALKVKVSSKNASGQRGSEMENHASDSLPVQQANSEKTKIDLQFSVEEELETMANSVVGFLVSNESGVPRSSGTEVSTDSTEQLPLNDTAATTTMDPPLHQQPSNAFSIESAALSIFRQEKVNELLHRANSSTQQGHPLASVSVNTVRIIIYKWIIRASHDSSPFLDPVIPSWTNFNELVAFFQRQIISENNRGGTIISGKIEVMKEAGAYLAEMCYSLAKEVTDFSKKYSESLPTGASDSTLNMSASELNVDNNNSVISIDWSGQSKVYLSTVSFSNIRSRYRGPAHLMLTSIFSTVKRYETMNMIVTGTSVDCRLPLSCWNQMSTEMNVSIELLSSPLSVLRGNAFCGSFGDIDGLFGGSKPFSTSGNDVEYLLLNQGGSAAVLPPLDSNTASIFMKKITTILDVAESKGLPVSIITFLPMLCFRDLKSTPSIENLNLLEPRLLSSHQRFIRHYEILPQGQHAFDTVAGQINVSNTGTMLLFLQNEAGKVQFNLTERAFAQIVRSISVPMLTEIGSTSSTATSFQHTSSSIPSSPVPPRSSNTTTLSPGNTNINMIDIEYSNSIGDTTNTSFSSNQGPSRRRGRLFDLVDDGEDDFNEVSGMLNNLNVSMFQDNSSQDVDIEAISLGLLGIGTAPSNTSESDNPMQRNRRFT